MSTILLPVEQRVLLEDMSWTAYETLLRETANRPIRLTYDRGRLEITTLSHGYEYFAELFTRIMIVMTEELDVPIHSGGCTTIRKELLKKGVEADKSFWVRREYLMRGRTDFDLAIDPAPDLVIEIEISRSALDRLSIYASLGISEVWRWDGDTLTFACLQPDDSYAPVLESQAFPGLLSEELGEHVRGSVQGDETSFNKPFRAWVREHVLPEFKKSRRRKSRREPKK